MPFLVRRRDDSFRLQYYSHFNGRHGIPAPKMDAPRFDEVMARKIVSQLEKLDNRDWEIFEDVPRVKKERPAKKRDAQQQSASA